jgi:hypothetical protein
MCPGCLAEIPVGYPYDHVGIDRVLSGDRALFDRMGVDEQAEAVAAGLARGMTLRDLATLLRASYLAIRALLPSEHPQSEASYLANLRRVVAEMYGRGQSDATIGAYLDINPTQVGRMRRELGLVTRRRTTAQVRQQWALGVGEKDKLPGRGTFGGVPPVVPS